MSTLNPAWLIGPWLLAWGTIWLLDRFSTRAPAPTGRHASIDGLRGHLALAVFVHHGIIWHGYLRTGKWDAPPSNLFNQLGQGSVALFFMITAFLFVGKLLDARHQPIDWTRLYVSRLLRLTPLYLLAVLTLLVICGVVTDWTLQTSWSDLLRASRRWLFFTIGGFADVNGLRETFTVISGVTWSLPLEWMFYLLLPGLALLMQRQAPAWLAVVAFVAAWGIWAHHKYPWMLVAFASGGLSAWLSRQPEVVRFARTPRASVWVATALVLALASAHTIKDWRPMLALTIAFGLISAGNPLFGALTARSSRSLGDLAYGVYLLHGLLLYASLTFVIGRNEATAFTAWQHWAWLMALTPPLVALAWLAFRLVERPCMNMTDAGTHRLKTCFARLMRVRQPQG